MTSKTELPSKAEMWKCIQDLQRDMTQSNHTIQVQENNIRTLETDRQLLLKIQKTQQNQIKQIEEKYLGVQEKLKQMTGKATAIYDKWQAEIQVNSVIRSKLATAENALNDKSTENERLLNDLIPQMTRNLQEKTTSIQELERQVSDSNNQIQTLQVATQGKIKVLQYAENVHPELAKQWEQTAGNVQLKICAILNTYIAKWFIKHKEEALSLRKEIASATPTQVKQIICRTYEDTAVLPSYNLKGRWHEIMTFYCMKLGIPMRPVSFYSGEKTPATQSNRNSKNSTDNQPLIIPRSKIVYKEISNNQL